MSGNWFSGQRQRALLALAAAATALLLAAPATAGGQPRERIYDDSFGNLVILSPSGYKRIVVGMGHVAAELEAERRAEMAQYGDGDRFVSRSHCRQPPVLWKGRSYMYGLADGEIPTPPLICD